MYYIKFCLDSAFGINVVPAVAYVMNEILLTFSISRFFVFKLGLAFI